jgi:hypothetical protein
VSLEALVTRIKNLRLTLLGVGAMNSPRYALARLLVEYGSARVMIDGGLGAAPKRRVAAWLVTDERVGLAQRHSLPIHLFRRYNLPHPCSLNLSHRQTSFLASRVTRRFAELSTKARLIETMLY